MSTPAKRFVRAAAAVLVVLWASLGSGDANIPSRVRRPVRISSMRVPRQLHAQQAMVRPRRRGYATDRVLVRFRPGVDETYADGLLRSYGFPAVRRISGIGVYSVRTAPGATIVETLALLRRNPDIALARPDYRIRLAEIPNDPYFLNYQYALRNNGGVLDIDPENRPQMTAGADIKATAAWDVAKGDAETIIAIVDTGVDMTHPDLVGKLVSTGHDFANDDEDATDDVWHGTHVAGIAAANTNNGVGIAGVAWNCRILPVKVTDANGDGFYSWIIDGIIWAADNGAKVINLSLGGDVDDPFLKEACQYAHDKGVVIVASAGNDGLLGVLFPAAYDDYVLAAAASDYNDDIADFSNFGPEIDVAAPGVLILGPVPQFYADATFGSGSLPYVFATGTSASAPHVSGMAALIRSAKPDLSVDDLMKVIRYTADDVNKAEFPGRDDHAGYGRINMARALVPTILR